jgi:hypothetical protein
MPGCSRTARLNPDQTQPPQTELASIIDTDDPRASDQLLSGFYSSEGSGRWTKSKFSFLLRVPSEPPLADPALVVKFYVPDREIVNLKSISLSAVVNGVALQPRTTSRGGIQVYSQSVPAAALNRSPARIDMALDKWAAPRTLVPDERRELGIVVTVVGFKNAASPEI